MFIKDAACFLSEYENQFIWIKPRRKKYTRFGILPYLAQQQNIFL